MLEERDELQEYYESVQSVQSDKNEANHLQGDIKSGNRYLSSDHKLRQMQRTRCYKTFLLKASQYFNAFIKHLYLVFKLIFLCHITMKSIAFYAHAQRRTLILYLLTMNWVLWILC